MNDPQANSGGNVDESEIRKFEAMAETWWDPDGDFAPIHQMNPLRLGYIDERAPLSGRKVLDIGCGGGILSEAMSAAGAEVTGIDLAPAPLAVARTHAGESGLEVEYLETGAEDLAAARPEAYDVVTCLEMLEHVPRPGSVIDACSRLVRPGGHVFFSTINRTAKAFALAIVGAEYLLRLLPRGTHEYEKLIRPSELEAWARLADLRLEELTGVRYNPLTRHFSLTNDVDVNYIAHFRRRGAGG
ncbi:bifunctional 2-polyprenyl-6-hydroxyphenol methylase/3-demethylubiquinol 3-O-methyltransferase UbiG [Lentisalinibacter sediminis]|uniref:bifunctional 2-polyprenyl-6-hydroxyphenol methylase/3-demethylubiquinol 3-O-methyltransferase UbiG n=1 Tax=Lentisalinibacter sediminis TaxID=2992237 RepID=UPI00386CCFC7